MPHYQGKTKDGYLFEDGGREVELALHGTGGSVSKQN